jgi:hypothetical protein
VKLFSSWPEPFSGNGLRLRVSDPDGLRSLFRNNDQSAVVTVETSPFAVWHWEDGRDHPEVERSVQSRSARKEVVGILRPNAILAGGTGVSVFVNCGITPGHGTKPAAWFGTRSVR